MKENTTTDSIKTVPTIGGMIPEAGKVCGKYMVSQKSTTMQKPAHAIGFALYLYGVPWIYAMPLLMTTVQTAYPPASQYPAVCAKTSFVSYQ